MKHVLLCALALQFFAATEANGQERTYAQSNGNQIVVTRYSPRELTDGDLPSAKLKENWNTDEEVRWDLTAYLALLSEQVYSDDDETLDFLIRGMGFTKWVAIKNETMAAHVVSGDGLAVVIFRGTNFTEIPDWYKNLTVAFETTNQGKFHSGFSDAYRKVQSEVRQFISDEQPSKLWITGHSLGGAMAVACGVDVKLNTKTPATMVTFGQPRFADEKGAKWIDQQFDGHYARFVHGVDIVPSVPFYVPWIFPYAHAGNLVAIHDERITLSESYSSTPALSANYCGSCGRATMQAQIPVYQPIEEPPPLTKAEYEQSLQTYEFAVSNEPATDYAQAMKAPLEFSLVPKIFADHFIDGYRVLVRRYRDGQTQMTIPRDYP
ncbi:lipase family protein [Rhodopirellula bahusiensis]|uniref:Fungal lipase-type domain-containing protein n=1 Tax=Rhodopirellula bahusiensis TaxID=2014065 RepID=A0A2G1W6U1_9BACT|nr:lipase family protein [Rhodopirellula bahusiensis]PHQ34369.1 hypothetical protein CEE69_15235 [Rhodopirellula bahusiensis]